MSTEFESKYNTWHKYTSYIKSCIRFGACGATLITGSVYILAIGFFIAELVGVAEEWV
jgi:hypothetical protein